MTNLQKQLFELQDKEYQKFQSKLMPEIPDERIIGVRVPVLRKLAKGISPEDATDFMNRLPHKYYEENNLHGYLIERIKGFDECIARTEEFLPYIDNWATCDSICPKIYKKNTDKLLPFIEKWLKSDKPFTVRYGVGLLMGFYLDEEFDEKYPAWVAEVSSDEYYVNMMRAWYFATALSKQYDSAVLVLEQNKLDVWTHNKTIQKAVESYRITPEQKQYLRTLKIASRR